MELYLDHMALVQAVCAGGGLFPEDAIAFLGCSREEFDTLHLFREEAQTVLEQVDMGRVRFRSPERTRPDPDSFVRFLERHGLPRFKWGDYADMDDYHKDEAAAVVEDRLPEVHIAYGEVQVFAV